MQPVRRYNSLAFRFDDINAGARGRVSQREDNAPFFMSLLLYTLGQSGLFFFLQDSGLENLKQKNFFFSSHRVDRKAETLYRKRAES